MARGRTTGSRPLIILPSASLIVSAIAVAVRLPSQRKVLSFASAAIVSRSVSGCLTCQQARSDRLQLLTVKLRTFHENLRLAVYRYNRKAKGKRIMNHVTAANVEQPTQGCRIGQNRIIAVFLRNERLNFRYFVRIAAFPANSTGWMLHRLYGRGWLILPDLINQIVSCYQ